MRGLTQGNKQEMVLYLRSMTMADQDVKAWEAEVAALPVRKQKIWKGRVVDSHGCAAVVRYVPCGCDLGFGLVSYFEQRLNAKDAAAMGLPPGSWIPVQTVAQQAEKYASMNRATGGRCLAVDVNTRNPYVPTPNVEDHRASFASQLSSNLTGNHQPHRHRVSVPTRAGEPVRG